MSHSEELRETIVSMQHELERLRVEATHASTLLNALGALLTVEGDDDPFAGVFAELLPLFQASLAIVLMQSDEASDVLDCVASNLPGLVGAQLRADGRLKRALAGRTVTTLASPGLNACMIRGELPATDAMSALYLPLRVRERRGLLILLRSQEEGGFNRSHTRLARKFSLLTSHALAARNAHHSEAESLRLKQLTDQLSESQLTLAFRANHDQLTSLPNRSYIQELTDQLIARQKRGNMLALAFIDLDEFKRINDLHGHAVGDALLCSVAQRIRAQLRAGDLLGRISGDEFVVVISPFRYRREITAIVQRIRNALHEPFDIDGLQVQCTGSIGVAFHPVHGHDYETLRRHADAAMYRAKTRRKGEIEFFTRALGRAMSARLQLEQRLRLACEERQFHCVLQAKVDLRNCRITGFETLMRWIDSQGVEHSPGLFLPLAGELGLLDHMASMQVEELLAALPQLDARFGPDMSYSINVSAEQASRPAFMHGLLQQITASGRAHSFMLELTEESFLRAAQFRDHTLPELRAAGVRLSIDDFGTGYSSLSLLAELTADEVKIDRSFITDVHRRPHNQSILRAIESLGRAFGFRLVAEGLETADELAWLRHNSAISSGQGYLFHRPTFIRELLRSDDSLPSLKACDISCSSAIQN